MQTKTLPESQNHGDWRESKSRRPFFRSLLGNCLISPLVVLSWMSLSAAESLFQSKNEPGEAPGTVVEEAPFRGRF
jgi:hypothetical protein